jgi:hypothetical protein
VLQVADTSTAVGVGCWLACSRVSETNHFAFLTLKSQQRGQNIPASEPLEVHRGVAIGKLMKNQISLVKMKKWRRFTV